MDQDKKHQEDSEEPTFSNWPEASEKPGDEAENPIDFDDGLEEEEDESQYFENLFAQRKKEDEEKKKQVRVALGKFNFFLHLTAYLAAVAYLLILGILYHNALLWVLIVIGLWTVGISYHFYWAFVLKSPPKKKKKKKPPSQPRGLLPPDFDGDSAEDLDQHDDEDRG